MYFIDLTLFGHTNFLFICQVAKKVHNSGGGIGNMSEGKEHIVAEHPRVWVVRIGRGVECGWLTIRCIRGACIWSGF
jgi:hypothetical protein